MESRTLRKIGLLIALASISFGGLRASLPHNLGNINGGAISGQYYASTAVSLNVGNDFITLDGSILVNGTAILGAYDGCVLTASIGSANTGGTVRFFPLSKTGYNSDNTGLIQSNYGHLIFNPQTIDSQVVVWCLSDVIFTGSNSRHYYHANDGIQADSSTDMVITFSGQGQTVFKMANGKNLFFKSQSLAQNGSAYSDYTASNASGCFVSVTMDQSAEQAVTQGINKLVFSRYEYGAISDTSFPAGTNLSNEIVFGTNSVLTFLSTNATGAEVNGDASDYAAIAFDVSSAGRGRLVLRLQAGNGNDWADGTVLLNGHLISNGGSGVGDMTSEYDVRAHTNWAAPAGRQAIMRVIDNQAYGDLCYKENLESGMMGDKPTARGLLIINECNTISPLMSNIYGDGTSQTGGIGHYGKTRAGFILGVNGLIEVNHNTFVEYIASGINKNIQQSAMPLLGTRLNSYWGCMSSNSLLKQHNPAALVVDGFLNPGEWSYTAVTALGQHAQINLYGQSQFRMSAGRDKNNNYDVNSGQAYIATASCSEEYDTYSFAIDSQQWDGYHVPSANYSVGEGVHVIDVGAWLTVQSLPDNTDQAETSPLGHHLGSGKTANGAFEFGSIRRDYAGREIFDDADTTESYVARPITPSQAYPVLNKPAMNLNAQVDFRNATLNITDVTHRVVNNCYLGTQFNTPNGGSITVADGVSTPLIVGGEAAYQNSVINATLTNTSAPVINLYNSTLAVHTNLGLAGVRIAVQDDLSGETPASNESTIQMFNYGNALDQNFGTPARNYARMLLLGSEWNQMSPYYSNDGATSFHDVMCTAHINVFRAAPDYVEPLIVGLEFTNGNENHSSQNGECVPYNNMQVVMMSAGSNMSAGWTTTVGASHVSSGVPAYPWTPAGAYLNNESYQFPINAIDANPATLLLGDAFYFGSLPYGSMGTGYSYPVINSDVGGALYANHGGRIAIANDAYAYVDASAGVLSRVWSSTCGEGAPQGLTGLVDLPGNQVNLINGVQGYNFNAAPQWDTAPYIALRKFVPAQSQNQTKSFFNGTGATSDAGSQAPINIPWNQVAKGPDFDVVNPLRALQQTRSLSQLSGPVELPNAGTSMIQASAGDITEQLQVSGATPANPIYLYLTGDETGYANVREIVSVTDQTSGFVPGQGAYGAIFMDGGAILGLGSRGYGKDANAWGKIGRDSVTIYPNGDCTIMLNQNITIDDAAAIIATTSFGTSETNQIIFYSDVPREVRVKSGCTFDLGSFTNDTTGGNQQQIVFSGRARLVVEPGATIRFPQGISSTGNAPVLYFDQFASLIFEGVADRKNKAPWTTVEESAYAKTRITGVGQIWLNKYATLEAFNEAIVGIETDANNLETNIIISVQRQAQFLLGDPNNVGGTFQVGNPANVEGSTINFLLRLDGEKAMAYFGRQCFFGLGAGILDVSGSVLNDWEFITLNNVHNVGIRHINGTIVHNQIADGMSEDSSVWALGQVGNLCTFETGPSINAQIRGGGNVLNITTTADALAPLNPQILSAASLTLVDDAVLDNGVYTIMCSAHQLAQATNPAPILITVESASEPALVNGHIMTGTTGQLYSYLSQPAFANSVPSRLVSLQQTSMGNAVGFIQGTIINRLTNVTVLDVTGKPVRIDQASFDAGSLSASGSTRPGLYGLV